MLPHLPICLSPVKSRLKIYFKELNYYLPEVEQAFSSLLPAGDNLLSGHGVQDIAPSLLCVFFGHSTQPFSLVM